MPFTTEEADAGTGGPKFLSDQIAEDGITKVAPYAKLMSGSQGSLSPIPGDETNGLYVQVKSILGAILNANTGGGTQNILGFLLTLPGSSGAVPGGTEAAPVKVEPKVGAQAQQVLSLEGMLPADQGNPQAVATKAWLMRLVTPAGDSVIDDTLDAVKVIDLLPDNTWRYAAAAGGLVNTTGVTAKAAAGTGIRNYIDSIDIVNSHQTIGTEIVIRDGAAGTVMWRTWAQQAGGRLVKIFQPPLRGTANTLVEIGEITATATNGVLVNLQGHIGP